MAQGPRYRVIEPTLQVEGGTPVEALEKYINDQAAEGYDLVATAAVREPDGPWVHVLILRNASQPPPPHGSGDEDLGS